MRPIYLDHAATTPLHPEVRQVMAPYLEGCYGNPSSVHGYGRVARQATERARVQVADLIGAEAAEVVFTSGGTEADNLAVLGSALANRERGTHVLVSSIEHHAVLHAAAFLRHLGFDTEEVPVGRDGCLDPDRVRRFLRRDTVLVACMLVNNETGCIQPVREVAAICREHGALLHCDAVQAAGHLRVDVSDLGCDLLALSAHKIYGPKGAGALYVRRGTALTALLHGGSQENQRRAGTENVAAIVGFGAAAALAGQAMEERRRHLQELTQRLEECLGERVPEARRVGRQGVPGIHSYSFPGTDGEALLYRLDLEGIAASLGAACSSGALSPSHVMTEMGFTREEAWGVLRFSMGEGTTPQDIDRLAHVLQQVLPACRRVGASR